MTVINHDPDEMLEVPFSEKEMKRRIMDLEDQLYDMFACGHSDEAAYVAMWKYHTEQARLFSIFFYNLRRAQS